MAAGFDREPMDHQKQDEPEQNRFVRFFVLFSRKWTLLVRLNLLWLACCMPVVTIGPATAAMTKLLRDVAEEKPVFLLSDFWDGLKSNWKQSFLYSIMQLAVLGLLNYALLFYRAGAEDAPWMHLPAMVTLFLLFVAHVSSFSILPMIVTLELGLWPILKNGVLLTFLCLKANVITVLAVSVIVLPVCFLIPYTLPLFIFIVPSLVGFVICYNALPGIRRYCVRPGRN